MEARILSLPLELRVYFYRHFVNIQVKRKEQLHPHHHKVCNQWYLNANRCLICLKVFHGSDVERFENCTRIPVNATTAIYHKLVRRFIP